MNSLYVVQDGTVDATQGGRRTAAYTAGDHWGDAALQLDVISDATFTARSTTTLLLLGRMALEERLGPFSVRGR